MDKDRKINEIMRTESFKIMFLVFLGNIQYLLARLDNPLVGGVIISVIHPEIAEKVLSLFRRFGAIGAKLHGYRKIIATNVDTVVVKSENVYDERYVDHFLETDEWFPIYVSVGRTPDNLSINSQNIFGVSDSILDEGEEVITCLEKLLEELQDYLFTQTFEVLHMIKAFASNIDEESPFVRGCLIGGCVLRCILYGDYNMENCKAIMGGIRGIMSDSDLYNEEIFLADILAKCLFDYLYQNRGTRVITKRNMVWTQDDKDAFDSRRAIIISEDRNDQKYYFIPEGIFEAATTCMSNQISFRELKSLLARNGMIAREGNGYTTKVSITPWKGEGERQRFIKVKPNQIIKFYGPLEIWDKLFPYYNFELKKVELEELNGDMIEVEGLRIVKKNHGGKENEKV